MLLQIQDGAQALTLRGGMQKMAAEGMQALNPWQLYTLPHVTSLNCVCCGAQAPSRPISGAMV